MYDQFRAENPGTSVTIGHIAATIALNPDYYATVFKHRKAAEAEGVTNAVKQIVAYILTKRVCTLISASLQ